ncbi:hypothetical protein TYRP_000881 [Tyrophagus putrescentiae]|nr:hypothetical protein TYRP_000881 [Tyrophagus putrescentiae]
MSAHVIFDPMDHLVFLHCDQEFERFLLQSNGFQESPWPPLPAQTEEEVRNLITLHLTPHVSVNRQLAQSLKHLESMADTCVAHQTSIEKLFLGFHMEMMQKELEDMLSVYLLTRAVQLYPGPGSDVSSECSNLDDSVTGERMYSHFQQLLADLARKASHSPSELVYEQADRILTLVWSRLQEYGEVAFKHLYHEEFPQHMQIYDQNVAHKMSDLLQDKLSTCIDYIQNVMDLVK